MGVALSGEDGVVDEMELSGVQGSSKSGLVKGFGHSGWGFVGGGQVGGGS